MVVWCETKTQQRRDSNNNRMTSTVTIKRPQRQTPSRQQRTQLHEEWKESLREACIARARKNRQALIWQKRHQPADEVLTMDTGDGPCCNDDIRSLVEQELRQQGVDLVTLQDVSHCDVYQAKHSPSCQPQNGEHENCHVMNDDCHFLSEEELYELLQDVEEELRRSEEILLEEILEQEQRQMEEMEQQIADYQAWEDSLALNGGEQDVVICPVCCEAMLRQPSPTKISCSNDACHFQLCGQTLSLADLKDKLQYACEKHSSVGCPCTLTMDILPSNDYTEDLMQVNGHLFGSCLDCDAMILIA